MNKKTKAIIVVAAVVVVAVIVGVLCWGLQPVKRDSVTLKELGRELGAKYCVLAKLPFEGDVKCFIIYNEQHWNLRFEITSNSITGYSIELKDDNRDVKIFSGMILSIQDQENVVMENYNNQEIFYIFNAESNTSTDNALTIQFEVGGKAYQIYARYSKDVEVETLKSDMKLLLDQMITQ